MYVVTSQPYSILLLVMCIVPFLVRLITPAEAKKYRTPKTYTWEDIEHAAGIAAGTRDDIDEAIFYAESDCLLMAIFIRIGPTGADELFEWDVWVSAGAAPGDSGAIMLAYFDWHQHTVDAGAFPHVQNKTSEWFEKMNGGMCIELEKGDSVYGLSQYFNGLGVVTADAHGAAIMVQIAEKD